MTTFYLGSCATSTSTSTALCTILSIARKREEKASNVFSPKELILADVAALFLTAIQIAKPHKIYSFNSMRSSLSLIHI